MISNCVGCKYEIEEAYKYQQAGFDVALEGMGIKEHCTFYVLNKGKIVVG